MHSQFTFNPNGHRAAPNIQQQSGFQQPIFIGAQPVISFVTHHHPQNLLVNHGSFTRSFASVVSCENTLEKRQNMLMLNVNKANINQSNNCSSGIIGSFLRHFNKPPLTQYHQPINPTPSQNKEFEDFTHMPSLASNDCPKFNKQNHYQQPPTNHINNRMSTPSDSCYKAQPPSANNNNNTTTPSRGFMASLFGGCQQQQGQPKPRNQRWFRNSFRNREGSWRSQNHKSGSRFHDHDETLPKNVHEKERSSIERDIKDDSCDFVHVVKCDNVISDRTTKQNNSNQTTAYATEADDPPFLIYSLDDFPAIVTTSPSKPAVEKKPPVKIPEPKSCDQGFVVVPEEATASTPTFTPKRLSLCEKIIKSPQKLFPTCTPIVLKPCLKAPRRRYSECSDDFIVFADDCDDYPPNDITISDNESETESEDDDDSDEDDDEEMSEIAEEDDEASDEEEDKVDGLSVPEHQVDSGVEEKMVSCEIKRRHEQTLTLKHFHFRFAST